MDNAKLQAITNSTPTATIAMLSLALRERDARNGYSNVTGMKEKLVRMGETIVDADFIKFWQDLEAAGVGNYIVGRRGNPDRFKWHISVKAVAQAAIEGKDIQLKALNDKLDATKPSVKPRGKRSPGRPKGSTNKAAVVAPKANGKRKRLSSEAKEVERRLQQQLRQALMSLS